MKHFLAKHSLVWGGACLGVLLVTSWGMPSWYLYLAGGFAGAYLWHIWTARSLMREIRAKVDAALECSRRERLLPGAEEQIALFQVREREGHYVVLGEIKDTLSSSEMMKLALWIYGLSRDIQAKAYAMDEAKQDDRAEKSELN